MKTALVLVDFQNDYFPGGRMELAGVEAAAAKAADLLALFRKQRWPVFFVQHIATGENASFFLPDTRGVEIHASLQPASGEALVRKHYPNSFRETPLQTALEDANVVRLVICGAMSHMCIDATTRAAADLNFECIVVADACATRDLQFGRDAIPAGQVHGAFMAALGAAYARITTCDELSRQFLPQS
jgi:nicotinamidase-related amidase